jgi:hypothetical protein
MLANTGESGAGLTAPGLVTELGKEGAGPILQPGLWDGSGSRDAQGTGSAVKPSPGEGDELG